MTKMMICRNKECSSFRLLKAEKTFCSDCGNEMEEAPKCKCNEYVSKFDKFCAHCGKPVQDV